MFNYYTVKELTDRIGLDNIERVTPMGRYVAIQLKGELKVRKCDYCKSGEHTSASVRPRLMIRNY